jgi:hypothetical protein
VVVEVTERAVAGDPARRCPRSCRRPATSDLLAEMCMQLEHQGLDAAEPNLLLACFQEAGHVTPATWSRYEFLATRAPFTGPTTGGATRSPSPTTPTWSSVPPSPCCDGWSRNADGGVRRRLGES